MRLFVINLARRTERMAFMERQLAAVPLDFERIDAIDGENLSLEDRERVVCARLQGKGRGNRLCTFAQIGICSGSERMFALRMYHGR